MLPDDSEPVQKELARRQQVREKKLEPKQPKKKAGGSKDRTYLSPK